MATTAEKEQMQQQQPPQRGGEREVVRVAVTGGAGQIAYALIPLLCNGLVFGANVAIELRLLDVPAMSERLRGVLLEIQDSDFPLLVDALGTTDPLVAFRDAQVCVLIGGFPRTQGMERADLIAQNALIMRDHGKALRACAAREVRVLVVANPANTNCLVAMYYAAPRISPRQFTCLTRLDHERLRGFVARTAGILTASRVSRHDVTRAFVWGNHSASQVPDSSASNVVVRGLAMPLRNIMPSGDTEAMNTVGRVQQRGAEIIRARGMSSAMSAANAIALHLRDWLGGVFVPEGETGTPALVSVGMLTDGNPYGIAGGLVCSLPCFCKGDRTATLCMIKDAAVPSRFSEALHRTLEELQEERAAAERILGLQLRLPSPSAATEASAALITLEECERLVAVATGKGGEETDGEAGTASARADVDDEIEDDNEEADAEAQEAEGQVGEDGPLSVRLRSRL